MERVEVKTKAAAEKALKAGKPIKIIAGSFALAITGLAVNIDVAPEASVELTLTDCGTWSSRAELRGSSRAELRGSSSAVLRESSSAVLWGSSSAELWGSSRAVLWESSSAVLWESSSAELWGSSSADAKGFSMLQVRSAHCHVEATKHVAVNLWNGASATGGRQYEIKLSTAQDWCDYYGVRTEGGMAIVYKGVGPDYLSKHGGVYTPGTMPEDHQWNGRKGECERGCGLNFSPTPRATHEFHREPAHYLECRIALDEMVVHFDGSYPQKCTARRVAAPLIEVDVDGNPVPVPAEAA